MTTELMTTELLGIDIGGTSIKWVRLAAGGRRVDEGTLPTPQTGPGQVVDALAELRRRLPGPPAQQVGVAIPGHLDIRNGTTLLVPNLPGNWAGYPFGALLRDRLGGPVTLVNDARAFGVAELHLGVARGARHAVFVVLGTGIGGAVALEGQVLRNGSDSVGEFGHATVVRGGARCGCGNRGCAEAYAGVRALVRRYQRSSPSRSDEESERASIVDRLRAGYDADDPTARRVIDRGAWAVGCAVTNLCVALGISTVVLGGGLGIHWPEFAVEMRRQLAERENLLGPSTVTVSELGDRAGAMGAALSAASQPCTSSATSEKGKDR